MKASLSQFTILLLSFIILAGCMEHDETAFEKQVKDDNEIIENYLTANNIQAERLSSGIHFEILNENPGGAAVEDESIVAIRYHLRSLDGKEIDSLTNSDQPLRFLHAQNFPNALYPRGINIGVGHMRAGERYRLYIPSYQAFEAYSFGQYLPRNANLIAEIEVESLGNLNTIEAEDKSAITAYIVENNLPDVKELPSGVYLQVLEEGTGDKAETGDRVKVSYKGYYLDDEIFDESEKDKPIDFYVGKNSVIPGFEEGIEYLSEGAKARIFIPSHLGFAEGIQIIPPAIRKDFLEEYSIRNWRPYAPVIFEVELIDIQ